MVRLVRMIMLVVIGFICVGPCLHGNVLFISERTDQPGSCQRFRDDAQGIRDYNSIEVNTGLKHGFLYRPMKEWIEPSVEWAQRTR